MLNVSHGCLPGTSTTMRVHAVHNAYVPIIRRHACVPVAIHNHNTTIHTSIQQYNTTLQHYTNATIQRDNTTTLHQIHQHNNTSTQQHNTTTMQQYNNTLQPKYTNTTIHHYTTTTVHQYNKTGRPHPGTPPPHTHVIRFLIWWDICNTM